MLIWLINVYWMLPSALNDWSSPKKNFHSLRLSIPSILPMLFQKPCFYYCLFSSFSHSLFYFKLYKISTDSTPIGNLWLCGLIKYNRFQISGNKSNETEEVKFLRSRNWLYTIFIRKTNLKLDLLSFNIFGRSEYEKMDILWFLEGFGLWYIYIYIYIYI